MKQHRFLQSLIFSSVTLLAHSANAIELEPGRWQFWKTSSPTPMGKPIATFCLTPEEAKNPISLIGDLPSDSGCEVRNFNNVSDTSSSYDLVCAGSPLKKASSVKTSGRVVTATVAMGSFDKAYIHGKRIDEQCSK